MKIIYNPSSYFIHIDFEPKWAFISSIRRFTENFIFTCINSQSVGKAVALSVSELLENAVKYSTTGKVSLEIKFQQNNETNHTLVVLKVYNFAEDANIKELQKLLDEIYQDRPRNAYFKRMLKVLEQEDKDIRSRLGLSRIRYEGCADLKLKVEDNNYITLTAMIQVRNE